MRKGTKVWLIVAIIHILVGAGIFTCFMAANDWNFKDLSTVQHETNTYQHFGEIKNIVIETSTADVSIECAIISARFAYVECYEAENATHSVTFEDGTLIIKEIDNRKWHDYIGINFDQPKIVIGLASQYFESVSIKTSTGDVDATMLWGETIDISVSTGDVKLKDIHCDNLSITGSSSDVSLNSAKVKKNVDLKTTTGDIELEQCTADNMSICASTGDVEFEDCDAANININVTTGDISGNFLTGKVFDVETDTGDVEVPRNQGYGKCTIRTSTGDVEITTD